MPFVLTDPRTYQVDTVRIVSFTASVAPRGVAVAYERGCFLGEKFIAVEAGTATFDAGALAAVDPGDKIYAAVKQALYTLLRSTSGDGSIT